MILQLLYDFKCPSVRLFVLKVTEWGNFSAAIQNRGLSFCLKISLINEHLFFTCFLRWSIGQATNGIKIYIYNMYNKDSWIYCLFYLFSSHFLSSVRLSIYDIFLFSLSSFFTSFQPASLPLNIVILVYIYTGNKLCHKKKIKPCSLTL